MWCVGQDPWVKVKPCQQTEPFHAGSSWPGPRSARPPRLPSRAEGQPAEPARPPGGYIDDHIHLTQPWFEPGRGPLTASILLRWMDEHGIEKAFILPVVSPEAFWYPISTEFVLRETQPHRDRLLPFCDIDPRSA